jgi:hypothetical protein
MIVFKQDMPMHGRVVGGVEIPKEFEKGFSIVRQVMGSHPNEHHGYRPVPLR